MGMAHRPVVGGSAIGNHQVTHAYSSPIFSSRYVSFFPQFFGWQARDGWRNVTEFFFSFSDWNNHGKSH
jgi:hypothetical protein